jgi:hypothetical protein
VHTKFWSGNLKERDDSEDLGVNRRLKLKFISGKRSRKLWNGFIWLRKEILRTNIYIYKIHNFHYVSEKYLNNASQKKEPQKIPQESA